jgi:hypothetical protein
MSESEGASTVNKNNMSGSYRINTAVLKYKIYRKTNGDYCA